MRKLVFVTFALLASIAMGADKKINMKMTKPAIIKKDVAGSLKWTGYGVGKSHGGELNIKSGQIEFLGDDLVGGTIIIDMKTLKTSDSPKLEGHLRSADFFDVDKFSEGTFKITKVEAIKNAKMGEATHKITGDLTIKGKTNTETFNATISKSEKGYASTAKAQIADRTKYDIVYNSAKFKAASALGDKLIKDNIDIEMSISTK